MATTGRALRQGLPRVAGGPPWPPAVEGGNGHETSTGGRLAPRNPQSEAHQDAPLRDEVEMPVGFQPLRRGLPRLPGGPPWPPEGFSPMPTTVEVVKTESAALPSPPSDISPVEAVEAVEASSIDPNFAGPFTRRQQFVGAGLLAVLLLVGVVGALVLSVRWFLTLEPMQEFIALYPGETHLPESAPTGFPAWLAWQHFFNAFFMVLIVRTGWQVRRELRPAAYWTGRGEKVSLTVWLHQSLDLLWLINGLLFVVLLFATGQWVRVVPTTWEVFPNALSALLQYISLDWPTENGWVNYNSLQVLAYFTTIFIAAPLAILTGFRMSAVWPKRAKRLSAWYPVEWARAVHFPVMLYFVIFIVVHVALVLSTGALRNLNHMYAAQGSTDPQEFADNWTGFIAFVASLAIITLAVVAARPVFVSPIARRFGSVTSR